MTNDYAIELLEEIFNQFEQDEAGIYFFEGGSGGDIPPVSKELQETLEEIAKLFYLRDTCGLEDALDQDEIDTEVL